MGAWLLACHDATAPGNRLIQNPTAPANANAPDSWSKTLTASGTSLGGDLVVADLAEPLLVDFTIHADITQRAPDGSTVAQWGLAGDGAHSCIGATNLVAGSTAITTHGSYCPGSGTDAQYSAQVVSGSVHLTRGAWFTCSTEPCPTFEGSSSVEMKRRRFFPYIFRENDPAHAGKVRYVVYDPNWIPATPYQYKKWGVIRNGVDSDITWWCGLDNICDNNDPVDSGLLYVDLRLNGEDMRLTYLLSGDGGIAVSALPDGVYSGDTVTFTVRGVPDTVQGQQINLYEIHWSWSQSGVAGADSSVTVCDYTRVCRLRITKAGTMKVTANYAGLGIKTAQTQVALLHPTLSLSATEAGGMMTLRAATSASGALRDGTSGSSNLLAYSPVTNSGSSLRVATGTDVMFTGALSPATVGGVAVSPDSVHWTWHSGADTVPACAGSWPTCRYTVSSPGHMHAHVWALGDSAGADAEIDEVTSIAGGIALSADQTQVDSGTTVEFTATSDPTTDPAVPGGVANLTDLSWRWIPSGNQSAAIPVNCPAGSPSGVPTVTCTITVRESGVLEVSGKWWGIVQATARRRIDVNVTCRTGNSLFDLAELRAMLRELLQESHVELAGGSRREIGALLVFNGNTQQYEVWRPRSYSVQSPCRNQPVYDPLPAGYRLVVRAHSHPFTPHSPTDHTPTTGIGCTGAQLDNRPSAADYNALIGIEPGVIIDRSNAYMFDKAGKQTLNVEARPWNGGGNNCKWFDL